MKPHWKNRVFDAKQTEIRFDWLLRSHTEVVGFTEEDMSLAQDWATGPMADFDPRIERLWDQGGRPLDQQLQALLIKFDEAVQNQEVARAAILYAQIEVRATELTDQNEMEEAIGQAKTTFSD